MSAAVPTEISEQLSHTLRVIERHLASTLSAVHLYGSALDGGLKPHSDIDLLVTVERTLDDSSRRGLLRDLLGVSGQPTQNERRRALEVTVVVHSDIVPWRYPARRELQFGEWLRPNILAGIFESPMSDQDLAILLSKARKHSIALVGLRAADFFDAVPEHDFRRALSDTLKLWSAPSDWAGDERNVVLTLARIWYSASTGSIASKDFAADWVMRRLPVEHHPVLLEARQAYLAGGEDSLALRATQLTNFVRFVRREAARALGTET